MPEITHEEMGICAELPGVQRAIDRLISYKDGLLERLTALRQARGDLSYGQVADAPAGRRGRPPKALLAGTARDAADAMRRPSGWPADPEERKAEMQRRMKVHAEKLDGQSRKLHPRDARHPQHEAWVRKMRRVQKAYWKNLSPDERNARQQKMHSARRAA